MVQAESGLHQNWMRDYDPTTGRYIQADPLGLIDGPAVYNYAMQSPNRYVDPKGERCYTYSRGDGNTYIKCEGPNTFCPNGDCAFYDRFMNDRRFDECIDECSSSFDISNWLGDGPQLVCTGVGELVGWASGANYVTAFTASSAVGEMCIVLRCAAKCRKNYCSAE